MHFPRQMPIGLLSFALALTLFACGDSNDANSSVGAGSGGTGAGGASQGGASSGGEANGGTDSAGANNGGSAGQTVGEKCEGITPEVLEISPSELSAMLEAKDFEFINVHIPYAGEIPGTDVHIQYTDTAAIEARLNSDVSTKAVLYCLTGPMSAIAAKVLIKLGYCQIYDMPAGMVGWEAEGFPVND
jgi:rhodanese-related sulfurtransferase